MKRLTQWIALLTLPLFLAACPDKDRGGDSGGDTAGTPLTTDCLAGQSNCYGQMYGQFPGFFPYPGQYGSFGGYINYWQYYYGGSGYQNVHFCQCGPGAYPVYHNLMGLGCVRSQALAPIAGFMGFWQLPTVNNHWTNIPQTSNLPPNNFSSCQNQVAQACFLNQPNSCGGGFRCRQVSGNSALGICTRQ